MANEAKRDVVWAWIGKLGAIATLVATVIGIITWLNNPTTKLHAEIETGEFEIPPRYIEFAASMEALISADSIKSALVETLGEQQESEKTSTSMDRVSNLLARTLLLRSKILEHKTDTPYRYYWNASVVNTGELPVNDVRLRLPGSTVAIVKREDGKYSIDSEGPVVEIGQVAAGEKIKVNAWSDSYVGIDDPAVHHAAGLGTIKIKGEFDFWEFMGNYWPPILFFSLIALALLFALAVMLMSRVVQSASEATKTSNVVTEQPSPRGRRKKRQEEQ